MGLSRPWGAAPFPLRLSLPQHPPLLPQAPCSLRESFPLEVRAALTPLVLQKNDCCPWSSLRQLPCVSGTPGSEESCTEMPTPFCSLGFPTLAWARESLPRTPMWEQEAGEK